MGVGIDFCCKTCRKSYYVGYGSYGNLIYPVKELTVEMWDAESDNLRSIRRNRHIRDLLVEHNSHDWTSINWDFESDIGGKLVFDAGDGYEPLIEDYGEYERINLQDVEPRYGR